MMSHLYLGPSELTHEGLVDPRVDLLGVDFIGL